MPVCEIFSLPSLVPYADALRWQRARAQARQTDAVSDALLLLEHPPTITLGRGARESDLLASRSNLAARGIAVVATDRGGEITFHAPGQLVGYPILDLRAHGRDLHRYLRDLEEVLIRTLAVYGLAAQREPGRTGVWVGGCKVAALGIQVSRWVTRHGFALNVCPDLTPFRRDFVPCGLRDRDVTSLAELLPRMALTRADVEPVVVASFAAVFGLIPRFADPTGIMAP